MAEKDCTCARRTTNHHAHVQTAPRTVPGLMNGGQQKLQHCSTQHHTAAHSVSERDSRKRPWTEGNDRRSRTKTLNREWRTKTAAPNSPRRENEVYQHLHCSSNYNAHKRSHQVASARDECNPRRGCRTDAPTRAGATRASMQRAHNREQQACALHHQIGHQTGPAGATEHRRPYDLRQGDVLHYSAAIRTEAALGAATWAAWAVTEENSSAGEGHPCSPARDNSAVPSTLTKRGNGNRIIKPAPYVLP